MSILVAAGYRVAHAGPTGSKVVAGSASITQSGTHTEVKQTSNTAILNHKTFNIGRNESINFAQPSKNALTVNRVTGKDVPTNIAGKMTANGNVWVLNPSGVAISSTAQVNVNGLIATTASISDADILSGRTSFAGAPDGSSVTNAGQIDAGDGSVVLVAPVVANTGTITTQGSDIALGAGSGFTVDFDGDGLTRFEVASGNGVSLTNTGTLSAAGGAAFISAASADQVQTQVVSIGGKVEATRIEEQGGVIVISGGDNGVTEVLGDVDASQDTGDGGQIAITGEEVVITETARIDASGAANGGKIEIGGALKGAAIRSDVVRRVSAPASAPLPTAKRTTVQDGAVITADAGEIGDGGEVIVWADETTEFRGDISAKGGFLTGDGGFAEVSGKQVLIFAGGVDLSAVDGAFGSLLLDPDNITISDDPGDANNINADDLITLLNTTDVTISTSQGTQTVNDDPAVDFEVDGDGDTIAADNIPSGDGSGADAGNITVVEGLDDIDLDRDAELTLDADGSITIAGSIEEDNDSDALSLILDAEDDIAINEAIVLSGDVTLLADVNDPDGANTVGNVTFGGDGSISAATVTIETAGAAALTLGDISATDLSVTTLNQNIAQVADTTIDVTGDTSLTAGAGTITLAEEDNDFADAANLGRFDASGASLTIEDTDAIVLGNIVTPALTVTTDNGDISQAGGTSITAVTSVVMTAGTGDITLDQDGNQLGNAVNGFSATGENIEAQEEDGFNLADITATGTLDLSTEDANNIAQIAGTAIEVTGDATLTSNLNITLREISAANLDLAADDLVIVANAGGAAVSVAGGTLTLINNSGDVVSLGDDAGGDFRLDQTEIDEIDAATIFVDSQDEAVAVQNVDLEAGDQDDIDLTIDADDSGVTLAGLTATNNDVVATAGDVNIAGIGADTVTLINGSNNRVAIGNDAVNAGQFRLLDTELDTIDAGLVLIQSGGQNVLFDNLSVDTGVLELRIDAGGGDVAFQEIDIAGSNNTTVENDLTILNAETVAQTDANLAVDGVTSIAANDEIDLSSVDNDFDADGSGDAIIVSADTITLADANALILGAVAADEATFIADDIDLTDTFTVTGIATFENTSDAATNLGVDVVGEFSLDDTELGLIEAGSVIVDSDDAGENVVIDSISNLTEDLRIIAGANAVTYVGASTDLGDLTIESAGSLAPDVGASLTFAADNDLDITISGNATLEAVTTDDLSASIGGSADLDDIVAGDITLSTVAGDVTGDTITADNLDLTVGGDTTLSAVTVSGGTITLTADDPLSDAIFTDVEADTIAATVGGSASLTTVVATNIDLELGEDADLETVDATDIDITLGDDATITDVSATTLALTLGDDVTFDGTANTISGTIDIDAQDNTIVLFDNDGFTEGDPSEIAFINGAVLATDTLILTSNGAGITVNGGDLTGADRAELINSGGVNGDGIAGNENAVEIDGLLANSLDIENGEGAVSFLDSATTVQGDLIVGSSGSIDQNQAGALAVTGATDLTSAGEINLFSTLNDFDNDDSGDAVQAAAGANSVTLVDQDDIILGTIQSGDLSVAAAGIATTEDITAQSVALLGSGVVTIANDITSGPISVTGNTIAVAAATLTATNAAIALTANDGLTVNGDLIATGGDIADITLSSDADADLAAGDLTIQGGSEINAEGSVTLLTGGGTLQDQGSDQITFVAGEAFSLPTALFDETDLAVTAGGAITQSGAVTVTGTSAFTSSQDDITLDNAGNSLVGEVSLDAANGIVALVNNTGLTLGDVDVGNNLDLDAAGTIQSTSTISVGGTTSLTANDGGNFFDVDLSGSTNTFTGAVSAEGEDIAISDAFGGNAALQLGTITTHGADGTVDPTIAGNDGDLLLVAARDITGTDVITVEGETSVLAAGQSVALGTVALTGAIDATVEDLTLTEADGLLLGTLVLTGDLDAATTAGNITDNAGDAISVAGTTDLDAEAILNIDNGTHTFGDLVTLDAGRIIDFTAVNAVTFGAVTSENTGDVLTTLATTSSGGITFTDDVTIGDGVAADLTVSSAGDVTQTGGTITADDVLVEVDGDITQTGGAIVANDLLLSNTGAVAVDFTLDQPNNVVTLAVLGEVDELAFTDVDDLELGDISVAALTLETGGALTQDAVSTVTVDGNATLTAGDTALTGAENAANGADITLANAANDFDTVEASGGNITLVDQNDVTLSTITVANTVSVTATDNLTNGAVSADGDVDLAAGADLESTGTIASGGNTNLTAGDALTTAEIDADGSVDLDAGTDITATDTITSGVNVTMAAGDNVTATDVTAVGNVSLTATANDISVSGTIDAGGDVDLDAGVDITTAEIDAGGDITLDTDADLVVGDAIDAGGSVDLISAGGITTDAITAAQNIGVDAAGDAVLQGTVTAGGNVDIAADQSISVAAIDAGGDLDAVAGVDFVASEPIAADGDATLVTGNDLTIAGTSVVLGRVDATAGNDLTVVNLLGADGVDMTAGNLLTFRSIASPSGSIDLFAQNNFQIVPDGSSFSGTPLNARNDVTLTSPNGSFLTEGEQRLQDGLTFRSSSGDITLDFGTAFIINDTDVNTPFTLDAPNGLSQIRIDNGIFAIGSDDFLIEAQQDDFNPFANVFLINAVDETLFEITGDLAFISDGGLSVRVQNTSIAPNEGAGTVVVGTPFVGGAFEDFSLFGDFATQSGQTAALVFRDAALIGLPAFVVSDENTANGCVIGLPSDCQPIGSLVLTLEFETGSLLGITFVDPTEDEDDPFSNRGDEEDWE
ncbi:MAG: filamentous hemagglutinin N-terminal domain-containing protein [Pseudomonadota bacterium]